jgi:hypothetical protein
MILDRRPHFGSRALISLSLSLSLSLSILMERSSRHESFCDSLLAKLLNTLRCIGFNAKKKDLKYTTSKLMVYNHAGEQRPSVANGGICVKLQEKGR